MSLLNKDLKSALKENTVNRSFDSFQSTIPERKGVSLGANLADFVGNTVYGVIDSAAFGIPSMLAKDDIVTEQKSMYEPPKSKYNNFLDDFGIQPLESETGWGRAGRGVGEALGFFIPFMPISKGVRAVGSGIIGASSRGVSSVIGRSVDDAIKSVSKTLDDNVINSIRSGSSKSFSSSNDVESIINGFLKKRKNLPNVMQSSVKDIESFGYKMERGMHDTMVKFLKESSSLTDGQIRDVSKKLSREVAENVKNAGKNGKFVDDLDGFMFNSIHNRLKNLGIDNVVSRNLAGYVGRTLNTTVDFFAYESIAKMARKSAGSEEEFNIPEDLKNSFTFSAAMTIAELITPFGKRASSFKDIARFIKTGAGSKRNWGELHKAGKITDSQAYQALNYFNRLSNRRIDGETARNIAIGKMPIKKVLKNLDDLYSTSRNELAELVKKDALKGIATAIPRAAMDALAFSVYMSSQDDHFLENLDDEYVISDLIIGAFMAMRNPGSVDRTARSKFRNNENIESKFILLETMGMDVKPMKDMVNSMSSVYRDIFVNNAVKEQLPEYQQIISILETADISQQAPENAVDSDFLSSQQRNILKELYQNFFIGKKMIDNGIGDVGQLNDLKEKGEIVDIDALSEKEITRLWNQIKDVEISGGGNKKISEYSDFDILHEDILEASVKTQEANIVRSLSEFAELFGLTRTDNAGDNLEGVGANDSEIIIRMPDIDSLSLKGVDLDNFKTMEKLLYAADKAGIVRLEDQASSQEKVDLSDAEMFTDELSKIVDNYNETINELDPNHHFSKGDNPVINLISRYHNFKKQNDFNLAIEGKERPSNTNLFRAISEVIGIETNSTGEIVIDFGDKNYDDLNDAEKERVDQAREILESISALKIISGKSSNSTKAIKVDMEKALKFMDNVTDNRGYMEFAGGGLYINGSAKHNVIRETKRRVLERSDLKVSDWIALNRLKVSGDFQVDNSGRVMLPSRDVMELALFQNVDGDIEKLTREESAERANEYAEILDRLKTSGSVVIVDNYSGEINPKDLASTISSSLKLINNHEKTNIDTLKQVLNDGDGLALFEDVNSMIDDLKNVPEEEVARKLRDINSKLSDGVGALFSTKDMGMYLEKITDTINRSTSGERLTTQLFENLSSDFQTMYDSARKLQSEVNKLTTNANSSYAYTAQSNFIRENILRQLDKEKSEDSLENLMNEYIINSSYENLTNLLNRSKRIFAYQMEEFEQQLHREKSSRDINELVENFTQEQHDSSKQKLLEGLSKIGSNLVDKTDSSKLSKSAKTMIEDDPNSFIDSVFSDYEDKTDSDFDRDQLSKDLASTIYSYKARSEQRTTFSVRFLKEGKSVIVYDPDQVAAPTKLSEFSNSIDGMTILKDEIIDVNNNKTTITSNTDSFPNYFSGITQEAPRRLENDETLSDALDREPSSVGNYIFVPLQASESIGVVFHDNAENGRKLKKRLDTWIGSTRQWIKENKGANVLKRFDDFIGEQRKNLINENGNLNIREAESLIRGMYYDNLSRDLFLNTIGFDLQNVVDLQKMQAKMLKYVKNTDNDNATVVTKDTARFIEKIFDRANTTRSKRLKDLLRHRMDNGINISVFEDEYDIETELGKKTSAYGTVERSIYETYRKIGLSRQAADTKMEELKNSTLNELVDKEQQLKSIGQSIVDGAVYASRDAIELDVGLMGGDFDKGQTSHKAVIYSNSNSSGDIGKSIIGKQNIFYDKEIAKLLEGTGIDYLMPKSAAKVWGGAVSEYKSFDSDKSVAENLQNISLSSENFGMESMKYLFSAHEYGKGKYNTSITHGWDRDALLAYSESMNIDKIVGDIARIAGAEGHISGLEQMILRKFEEIDNSYSHLKGIEKLIKLGDSIDNTLVKDMVLDKFKKMTLDQVLKQTSDSISNGFLKGNNNLRSPIYARKGTQNSYSNQYVKSFGEIRLPDAARNVTLSERNSSIVFKHINEDGDFQDYILGADGKIYDPKRSSTETNDIFDSQIKEDLSLIMDRLVKGNQQGDAHSFMTMLSGVAREYEGFDKMKITESVLNRSFGTLKDKFINDEQLLEASARVVKNLKDFSLGVNTHKIPKKYMSDSIVNRLEGFLDSESGNYIEANNYEIAINHQADQDGDKIWVYSGMPPEVLRTSANNMALGKDFASIGDSNPFPNLYNNSSRDGINKGMTNAEGILKHLGTIKRSRFAIGTAVKLQGVTTMLSASNFRMNPKSGSGDVYNFLNVNSQESKNFNKRLITVLQNILDPHNGVEDSLLNTRNVIDFILFGDKSPLSDKIKNTSNEVGAYVPVFDLDKMAKNFGINNPNDADIEVVKDIAKEIYNIHSKVYSAMGDVYDSGVADTPDVKIYKEIYKDYRDFSQSPMAYIAKQLGKKYYYQDKGKTKEASKKELLKSIISEDSARNSEGFRLIKEVFGFSDIENHYPQLRVLKNIYDKAYGKKDTRTNKTIERFTNVRPNSVLENIYNTQPNNLGILFEANNELMSFVDDDFEKKFSDLFNKENKKTSALFAEKAGAYKHMLQSKSKSLRSKIQWLERKGYDSSFEKNQLKDIIDREKKFDKKVRDASIKSTKDKEAFTIRPNKSGYITISRNLDVVHVYKDNGDDVEFFKTMKAGESARVRKGEYIVMPNPIMKVPMSEQLAKEGFAMEMATEPKRITYLNNILTESIGTNEGDALYTDIRKEIERAKRNLRENFSETMEVTSEAPVIKQDAWVENSNREKLILGNMFTKIDEIISRSVLDDDLKGVANEMASRMMMQPRAVQGSYARERDLVVPYYKNENRWLKSILTTEVLSSNSFNIHLENIYKSFSNKIKRADGINVVEDTDLFHENADTRLNNFKKGRSILRSMSKYSKLDPQLDFLINSSHRSKLYSDEDNKTIFEYYNKEDKIMDCNL